MNFKTISSIIALLSLDLLALSSPINKKKNSTDSVDIFIKKGRKCHIINEDKNLMDDAKVTEINFDEEETEEVSGIFNLNEEENICNTEECIDVSERLLDSIDSSVDPCEDFYQFTCGNWMKNPKNVKNSESGVEEINKALIEIIEGDYHPNENLSEKDREYDEKNFNKIKGFYKSCMEADILFQKGNPYIDVLNQLNINNKKNYKDINELTKTIAKLHNINSLYSIFSIFFDLTYNNDINKDIVSLEIMKPNILYIKKELLLSIFKDSKDRDIDKMIDSINEFSNKLFNVNEKVNENGEINNISENNIELLDKKLSKRNNLKASTEKPENNNNEKINKNVDELPSKFIKVKSLNEKYPNINWKLYLEERFDIIGKKELITDDYEIIISDEDYFEKLNQLLNDVDNETLSYYIEWHTIFNLSTILPDNNSTLPINDQNDNYRSKLCFTFTGDVIPDILGKFFVDNYFTPYKKEYSEKVIEYIKQSMVNRIPQIEWLDDETIEYAYKKVAAMKEHVGYNEKIMNPKGIYEKYEEIGIYENDFINSMFNYFKYTNGINLKYTIMNLSEELDETEYYPPFVRNAVYNLYKNSMMILAGILQPPFFSAGYPDYINYSSIGSVIGHEFTHAFDNNGKDFDMNGNYSNWWTENDLEEYEELTKCFIDQYNKYYFVDNEGGKHYNDGKSTLNENIADNGGLNRAYESWKQSLKEDPETVKKQNQQIPGLTQYTQDQLFFISFGQMWCVNYDLPGSLLEYVLSSDTVHSSGSARVNGPVSNSEYFAKAFNCPLKSKMNPEKKCIIW